jgi:hypothetical protein
MMTRLRESDSLTTKTYNTTGTLDISRASCIAQWRFMYCAHYCNWDWFVRHKFCSLQDCSVEVVFKCVQLPLRTSTLVRLRPSTTVYREH